MSGPAYARAEPNSSCLPGAAPSEPAAATADGFIFVLSFMVPSGLRNSTCKAPAFVPPSSSPVAPTTISVVPSPSRSPAAATEEPNLSPRSSPAMLFESIFCAWLTVPLRFRDKRYTDPARDASPDSSFGAPTAIMGSPSPPARGPTYATDAPNRSPAPISCPGMDADVTGVTSLAVPLSFRNMTCAEPADGMPPYVWPIAPTTISVVPSPSRSPAAAAADPNLGSSPSPCGATSPARIMLVSVLATRYIEVCEPKPPRPSETLNRT